jgi:hypothetical protein
MAGFSGQEWQVFVEGYLLIYVYYNIKRLNFHVKCNFYCIHYHSNNMISRKDEGSGFCLRILLYVFLVFRFLFKR